MGTFCQPLAALLWCKAKGEGNRRDGASRSQINYICFRVFRVDHDIVEVDITVDDPYFV